MTTTEQKRHLNQKEFFAILKMRYFTDSSGKKTKAFVAEESQWYPKIVILAQNKQQAWEKWTNKRKKLWKNENWKKNGLVSLS